MAKKTGRGGVMQNSAHPGSVRRYVVRRVSPPTPRRRELDLPQQRVGALMQGLRGEQDTSARALEFIILTVCRLAEACHATWEEFDLAAGVWTIPAERSRSGKARHVALSDAAIAVLEQLRGCDPTAVFPGLARRGDTLAFLRVLERLGWPATTARAGRAAFQAWAEAARYPRDGVRFCLGFGLIPAPRAAYLHSDQFEGCRALMAEWAAWCATVQPDS